MGTTLSPTLAGEADLALLDRYIHDQDGRAFAEVVRRYGPAVFGTAVRILGNSTAAEDATQETFFRLMKRPDSVTESLGGWLHRAVTRLAVDAWRSESCRKRRELFQGTMPSREASTWSELSPYVDEALAEMPDDQRYLLVQFFLMSRTQSDLAAEANVSPATLSRRVARAVADLQARLRRKGLAPELFVLEALLYQGSARALPAHLAIQLNKIAMVSTAGAASPGLAAPHVAANHGLVPRLVAGLGLLVMALCVLYLSLPHPQPKPAPGNDPRLIHPAEVPNDRPGAAAHHA